MPSRSTAPRYSALLAKTPRRQSAAGDLTYPGTTQLPAANCVVHTGGNGTITIDVPLSNVNEPGAIDNRLHEVTASTMTLQERANTNPPVFGIGGSLFNLIDVAQGYTFNPGGR